jgi:hypothetical protein
MGAKYFKGRVLTDERMYRFVVWDGLRDYESPPLLPQLAAAEGFKGRWLVVQTHKHDWHNEDVAKFLVDDRDLIIWTRDAATYRGLVKNLSAEGARLQ